MDASFADCVRTSNSSSGMYLAVVGANTFMFIIAFNKTKQSAVSHTSTEAEIIALEEAARSEAIPALTFWEYVVMVFGSKPSGDSGESVDSYSMYPKRRRGKRQGGDTRPVASIGGVDLKNPKPRVLEDLGCYALRLDHVADSYRARELCPPVKLIIAEDNEAVIQIISKGRSAKMRHIHRTHRVDTDWFYEIFGELGCILRYVNTKHQLVDIFAKAITNVAIWSNVLCLNQFKLEGDSNGPSKVPIRDSSSPVGVAEKKKKNKKKDEKSEATTCLVVVDRTTSVVFTDDEVSVIIFINITNY